MEKNWSELNTMFPKVRKWSEKDIMIKLTNLAKKLGWLNVQTEIDFQKKYTDNTCDAMNLAYYSLKNKFSKIKRERFGFVRTPEYEPKKKRNYGYDMWINYNDYMGYNDYPGLYATSYTVTTSTYTNSIW
jgi:hypothetical protein